MKTLAELRDERRARETALAESQGLDIGRVTSWGAGRIDPIEADLLACSTDYAESAAALGKSLEALSSADLSEWFAEIGWGPVGSTKRERLDDYIRRG